MSKLELGMVVFGILLFGSVMLPFVAWSDTRPPLQSDDPLDTQPTTQPITVPDTVPDWMQPLPPCPPVTRPEDPVGTLAEQIMRWTWWQGPRYEDCAWVDQRGRHWPPSWNPERDIRDAMQLIETILEWRMGLLQFEVRLESVGVAGWTCTIAPMPGCLPLIRQSELRRDGWGCTLPQAICAAAERWGADWVWFDVGTP